MSKIKQLATLAQRVLRPTHTVNAVPSVVTVPHAVNSTRDQETPPTSTQASQDTPPFNTLLATQTPEYSSPWQKRMTSSGINFSTMPVTEELTQGALRDFKENTFHDKDAAALEEKKQIAIDNLRNTGEGIPPVPQSHAGRFLNVPNFVKRATLNTSIIKPSKAQEHLKHADVILELGLGLSHDVRAHAIGISKCIELFGTTNIVSYFPEHDQADLLTRSFDFYSNSIYCTPEDKEWVRSFILPRFMDDNGKLYRKDQVLREVKPFILASFSLGDRRMETRLNAFRALLTNGLNVHEDDVGLYFRPIMNFSIGSPTIWTHPLNIAQPYKFAYLSLGDQANMKPWSLVNNAYFNSEVVFNENSPEGIPVIERPLSPQVSGTAKELLFCMDPSYYQFHHKTTLTPDGHMDKKKYPELGHNMNTYFKTVVTLSTLNAVTNTPGVTVQDYLTKYRTASRDFDPSQRGYTLMAMPFVAARFHLNRQSYTDEFQGLLHDEVYSPDNTVPFTRKRTPSPAEEYSRGETFARLRAMDDPMLNWFQNIIAQREAIQGRCDKQGIYKKQEPEKRATEKSQETNEVPLQETCNQANPYRKKIEDERSAVRTNQLTK